MRVNAPEAKSCSYRRVGYQTNIPPTAYVQDYTAVPLSLQSDNDKAPGFQQITLGGMDSMRFILPSSFVHHTFIVNTDDICLNHYFVNDLINLDMYLHLNQ